MTKMFEVEYTPLEAQSTAKSRAVAIMRATTAMADSGRVRQAGVAVFFKRRGDSFTASSSSRRVLESLPRSYGSVLGHFGEFERGEALAVPAVENFQAVYAISPRFSSLSRDTRLRLAVEVGKRLLLHVTSAVNGLAPVRVQVSANSDLILLSAATAADLELLPRRFNAVFERSSISAM